MPELPEVETITRDLQPVLKGLFIKDVQIYDKRVIARLSPEVFIRRVEGRRIADVYRRGKAIVIVLDPGRFLVVQLKMTGQLIYGNDLKKEFNSNDTKVVFRLSNGRYLNYNDQRTFGWLYSVDSLDEIPYFNSIGPEPFDKIFETAWLKNALHPRTAPIKTLLLNQQVVAGIGNIYASEILFNARIRPTRKSNSLKNDEISRLRQSSIDILNEAIHFRGSSMRNYRDSNGEKGKFNERIKVYGRDNEPCPACTTPITRIVQAGRSTFYCRKCQK